MITGFLAVCGVACTCVAYLHGLSTGWRIVYGYLAVQSFAVAVLAWIGIPV